MSQALQTDAQKTYEAMQTTWFELASRATRVLIAKRGMQYRDVASALTEIGVDESSRSVEGKIHRGTFAFTFFLQLLVATKSHCPFSWRDSLAVEHSWEQRASSIILGDMVEQRWLTYDILSRNLRDIGVVVPAATLHAKFRNGTLSTALFLQYATVRRLEFVHSFLDWSELNETAAQGGRLFNPGAPVAVEAPLPRTPNSNPAFRRWLWRKWPASR
jgi:hypothetical protein